MKLEEGTSAIAAAALASRDFSAYEEVTKPYEHSEVEDQLWAEIARAHPSGFDVFECLMAWSVDSETARSSRRFLLPVVGHVQDASVHNVLRLLEYTHVLGISNIHFVGEQLTELFKRDATLCVPVGEALATRPYSESAVPAWATTFAQAWPAAAARYVLALAERGLSSTRILAHVLRPIPADDKGAIDVLLPHAPAISKVLVEQAGSLGRDAWSALAAMIGYSVDATDALLAAVQAGEEGAISVLCVHLYRLTEPTVGATKVPIADVLHLLMATVVADHRIGHHVDSVMHLLFGRPGGKKTVIDELIKLADVPIAVAEVFPDTFHVVSSDAEQLSTLVTSWVVSPSFDFAPLNSALSFMSARGLGFELDASVFSAASMEMKVKSARRMLVGSHDGPLLCKFVSALVEPAELQPVGLEIGIDFMNLLLREYPQSSRAFLDGKLGASDGTTPPIRFYARALEVAKQQAAMYESLPVLKELQPSVSERLAMGAMRNRRSRDIGRKADEGSIFASLFQRTHIAQGSGFIATTSHAGQQVVQFTHFEYSMELPVSHISDPVGAWMMRRSRVEEAK